MTSVLLLAGWGTASFRLRVGVCETVRLDWAQGTSRVATKIPGPHAPTFFFSVESCEDVCVPYPPM
jgi:hypothetical protein